MEPIGEPVKRAITDLIDEWLEILAELPESEHKALLIRRINRLDEMLMSQVEL